ncbi:uncharacterized protein LOC120351063 [Nilaparvata lugens]|uniref:uncharacterized protein LOC120351063 n=1 Tax=Nilaparvata lugens TaxID=108931 RepID=UPI00193E7056|nr:uncharacterized protein LOC120351063 [Nilaparvata lugens]
MIPLPKPWTPVIIWLWLTLAPCVRAAHSARDGGTSRFWSESANRKLPVYQVQAVAGDAVFLPCDISTTDEQPPVHHKDTEDAVLLVLWYREDLGTPIYSVDARERDFKHAERWSDEHVFSNRAYFMPERQPAELGVDHIRETDAGVYRCRVDFKIAQTRNSKVNLTVIGIQM